MGTASRPPNPVPPVAALRVAQEKRVSRASPPDFIIIGASKCGTTSLYEYLSGHHDIFMTELKEPSFFLPEGLRAIGDEASYRALFRRARPHQLCGEASALYLYYENAIPDILAWNPDTKFIVSIRNPIDMAVSYHNQTFYSFEEIYADFEKAWRSSDDVNRPIGPNCADRKLLDYKSICHLGEQVQRVMGLVKQEQVHVVVFDDLCADPAGVYARALEFLGVRPDRREVFPIRNARKEHRFQSAAELVLAPPSLLVGLKRVLRQHAPVLSKRIARQMLRLNSRPGTKSTVDPQLRAEMVEECRADVELLSRLVKRDLSSWLTA